MAKNDFEYARNDDNECGTIMTFHQVTAPCNVACGSGIVTVNSPSGSTLQCDTWLWDDMTCHRIRLVAAPCNVTCSSGIDIEFARWQHPAVWQVALGWHAIEFTQTPAILEFYIWFWFWPHHRSWCHSAPVSKILSKSDHPWQEKNDVMSIFKMADLSHLGFWVSIMVALKSPITTY